MKWGAFAEYTGKVAGLLFSTRQHTTFTYEKFMNSRFASRIEGEFTDDELDSLAMALNELGKTIGRDWQRTIPQDYVSLLERAQEAVGDLSIGYEAKSKLLREIKIPSADG